MRKILALFAALALSSTLLALPAQADDVPYYGLSGIQELYPPSQTPTSEDGLPLPFSLHHTHFWSPQLCVTSNSTALPLIEAVNNWNARSSEVLRIVYAANCVSAGYPPSRRFNVNTYSANDATCGKVTDASGNAITSEDYNVSGQWYLWNNNPIIWVNTFYIGCYSTLQRRKHYTSSSMGYLLGFLDLTSAATNTRVMNQSSYAVENIAFPSNAEGTEVRSLYAGAYN